ncbi:heavy metal translocating P-type ATPase [Clostridium formicaceticum]|uniref:Cd(2+)-exporting ATPase n=1 Tax=Clostridium formicaceticum TaxID=1497 RepID=A0AAC9WHV4_9CLOT|nr:cation-translocating P-type ATPase [Clostridium formicaceticum]AOY74959.1 copper-translocating P-type ATPase [Clostridium formicaceticum]ARE89371.1 putative copper-exporting P-type ATPase V [Clostridium formicaceticum]
MNALNVNKSNTVYFRRYFFDEAYRTITLTTLSGIFLIISWFGWFENILPFDAAWVSIIISGSPILRSAAIGIIKEFDIKAGLLVSIALIASVSIGEYFAAGEIAFIMMLGEILEDRTVRKAQEGIKKLIHLTPQTATIRTASGEMKIPASDVKVGDLLLIKPGEAIPVDGIITHGMSTINQSILTGESMPVDKTVGDEVYIGTLNQLGAIEVEATKVGEDTSLSKLIRLVKDAEKKKAPVVRIADKMANVIVPLALLLSLLTYIFTQDITRAVTILVVFCPCALVLATPTAIVAGIGNAAKRGILIKSGEALEKMGKVDTIAFDKTGTITVGKPEVVDIISISENYTEDFLLRTASVAEKFSEHPLGKAIYAKAQEKLLDIPDPDSFRIELGQGVLSTIQGKKVLVGNLKLLQENNIKISQEYEKKITFYESQGKTVMNIAIEDMAVGLITVADRIKDHTLNTMKQLKKIGIKDLLLLTGDNKNTALFIAEKVGIDEVYSQQLPEDKVKVIEKQLENQKKVCMIGDGINDAPALAIANVGVAMGALGTDVAIETADIALMSDDISKVPELITLSKKVFRKIVVNIFLAMFINIAAIILAMLGMINPVVGALVHNLGSIVVVMNSTTLLKLKA